MRARGLYAGLCYIGGMDWSLKPTRVDTPAAVCSTILDGPGHVAYADAHWGALIERYRPSVLWGDIMYPPGAHIPALCARYYDRVPTASSTIASRRGSARRAGRGCSRPASTTTS